MTTPTTLAQRICDAEIALQKLMTGSMREEVRYQDGLVRFTPADVNKLTSYIAELKSQAAGGKARAAIGVQF